MMWLAPLEKFQSRNNRDMVKAGTLLEAEVNNFMIMVPIPKDYFLPKQIYLGWHKICLKLLEKIVTNLQFIRCSACNGHASNGTARHKLSSTEFQPQWVKKPPTAG